MTQAIEKYQNDLPSERIAKVHVDITDLTEAAEKLSEMVERAEITDAETYAKGGDLIKIARTNRAKAEDLRKELVGPYNALVKFINGQFKPVTTSFDKVRSAIEQKMLVWKKAEDKRLADEARKEREKLEAEALERAEQEKTEEGADAVMDAAAEAGEKVEAKAEVGLQRGSFGSSTGTRKKYSTTVLNQAEFLESLLHLAKNGEVELGSIVEFRTAGLNNLAKYMITERTAGKGKTDKVPGAEFVETDSLRVY